MATDWTLRFNPSVTHAGLPFPRAALGRQQRPAEIQSHYFAFTVIRTVVSYLW